MYLIASNLKGSIQTKKAYASSGETGIELIQTERGIVLSLGANCKLTPNGSDYLLEVEDENL